MRYGVRDEPEYTATHKREMLTIWSGPFYETYEGTALSLPNGQGYMVTTYNDGEKVRVLCPSPRTSENFHEVDNAISEALTRYHQERGAFQMVECAGPTIDHITAA